MNNSQQLLFSLFLRIKTVQTGIMWRLLNEDCGQTIQGSDISSGLER